MTLSDRIVVMNGGLVQQVGTPEEVYSRPANRFVAEFIGTPSMNMVEGAVRAENGGAAFTAPGFAVPLPANGPATPRPGQATLGFRPEDVRLVALGQPGAVPATVTVSELAGAERYHFLSVGGAEVIVRTPAATVLHPGEAVALGLDPGVLHLFDGTGEDARAVR
jgi:ABC-type sugar transport system ATPase subunit